MMAFKYIDISGLSFGRLKVISHAGTANKGSLWNCLCECGNVAIVRAKCLKSGSTMSCGCLHKQRSAEACIKRLTKHGKTAGGNTRVYRIWANMISRCTNANFDSYKYYGGRGITVCNRWLEFTNFLKDMGEPGEKESIDRIDSNGNYEPENCRWATRGTQMNNTRRNVFLEIYGRSLTVAQWSNEPNAVPAKTIYCRLKNGWGAEDAVFRPIFAASHGVRVVDPETGEIL